ncbi:hypothetical protein ACFQWB_14405 [Paenibacillus thermoaerophilus]|uniref:DUF4476 domain-containing protein n=1 Tax=Paenibacillus thermoaerophilus TaxID=1215385 RepID=A0ABW2V4Q4_9BACL|nr:hypothetical protein [Paenibacillus thermoaerophilus]TMV06618.1 hypothetical protein FE781_16720 [Paenibacillus thermoaerophilus]
MRWIWRIGRLAIGAAVISMVSVATTWYAVNRQVEAVMKQLNLQPVSSSLDWNPMLSGIPVFGGLFADKPAAGDEKEGLPLSRAQSTPAPSSEPEEDAPADAVAVWGSVSGETGAEGQGGDAEDAETGWTESGESGMLMSTEQFQSARDLMSPDDRMRVFSLLANRLKPEELMTISGFVEDGITLEEYRELERIVKNRLQPEEFRELQEIIGRYEG